MDYISIQIPVIKGNGIKVAFECSPKLKSYFTPPLLSV